MMAARDVAIQAVRKFAPSDAAAIVEALRLDDESYPLHLSADLERDDWEERMNELLTSDFTAAQLAELLAHHLRGIVKHDSSSDRFYGYAKNEWSEMEPSSVVKLCRSVVSTYAAFIDCELGDLAKELKILMTSIRANWSHVLVELAKIEGIESAQPFLASHVGVPGKILTDDGVFDFETGKIDDKFDSKLWIRSNGRKVTCDETAKIHVQTFFQSTLGPSADDDEVKAHELLIGYLASGVTSEKYGTAVMWYGAPDCGKSTLIKMLRAVRSWMCTEDSKVKPDVVFTKSTDDRLELQNALIQDKTLVTFDDLKAEAVPKKGMSSYWLKHREDATFFVKNGGQRYSVRRNLTAVLLSMNADALRFDAQDPEFRDVKARMIAVPCARFPGCEEDCTLVRDKIRAEDPTYMDAAFVVIAEYAKKYLEFAKGKTGDILKAAIPDKWKSALDELLAKGTASSSSAASSDDEHANAEGPYPEEVLEAFEKYVEPAGILPVNKNTAVHYCDLDYVLSQELSDYMPLTANSNAIKLLNLLKTAGVKLVGGDAPYLTGHVHSNKDKSRCLKGYVWRQGMKPRAKRVLDGDKQAALDERLGNQPKRQKAVSADDANVALKLKLMEAELEAVKMKAEIERLQKDAEIARLQVENAKLTGSNNGPFDEFNAENSKM